MENGMLTQTLKIKRPVVTEHYRDMIDGMFWNIRRTWGMEKKKLSQHPSPESESSVLGH
jgi:hypothetical protein